MTTRSNLVPRASGLAIAAALACSFDATGLGDEVGGATPPVLTSVATSGTGTGGSTTGALEETEGTVTGTATGTSDTTAATTMPPPPGCGDGTVDPGEDCDGGPNNESGRGCTPQCTIDVCGDGYVGDDEFCDLGPAPAPGLGCTPQCTANVCGDGYVGEGEGCDDGAANGPSNACTDACVLAACGDGKPGPGELCDDGNNIETDACLANCMPATCGDGQIQAGVEICDLGADNGAYQSACNTTCNGVGPFCGDGVWDKMHELCDGDDRPEAVVCDAKCVFTCETDFGDCNHKLDDGCEEDLRFSKNHCKTCDHPCQGFGNLCINKACTY